MKSMAHGRVRFLLHSLLLIGVFSLATAQGVGAKEISADEDLCRTINDPATGDELILKPGDFRGPCRIRRGGSADRPLVIRAKSLEQRPRIVYAGDSSNVIEIHADHVVLIGLVFGPTRRNVDGVRIRSSKDVSLLDCSFVNLGGIAVAANQSNLAGLRVSGNTINGSSATAMYFGCHDGMSCRVSDLLVERNRIDDVTAGDQEVGYGIQVKLNSTATIRDNVIKNTKGPPIMVYGSQDPALENVIERNFVAGSRTSSGIVIGGGPVVVRNNIAVGNAEAGIGLENYGNRNLLRGIKIGLNTVYGNESGGIMLPKGKVAETEVIGNAGWSPASVEKSCFVNPDSMDFSPAYNSRLDRSSLTTTPAWLNASDFLGQKRNRAPRVGAVESNSHARLLNATP